MAKKHAAHRRSDKRRRRADKRRRKARSAGSSTPPGTGPVLQTTWFGERHADDDDCPWCRAQRELGLSDGVPLSPKQYQAYKKRVDEIIATEGMPDGAVRYTGEQFERRNAWIDARLRERGKDYDLDTIQTLSDAELLEHMELFTELSDAYDNLN